MLQGEAEVMLEALELTDGGAVVAAITTPSGREMSPIVVGSSCAARLHRAATLHESNSTLALAAEPDIPPFTSRLTAPVADAFPQLPSKLNNRAPEMLSAPLATASAPEPLS